MKKWANPKKSTPIVKFNLAALLDQVDLTYELSIRTPWLGNSPTSRCQVGASILSIQTLNMMNKRSA